MKRTKRFLKVLLSALVLLVFTVASVPLDVLHNHKPSPASCTQDQSHTTCSHKLHISKKADFCLACAIHIDKSFTRSNFVENIRLNPVISIFIENDVTGTVFELILKGLRGPPIG